MLTALFKFVLICMRLCLQMKNLRERMYFFVVYFCIVDSRLLYFIIPNLNPI